jgi:mRNA interferase RelE/StbE
MKAIAYSRGALKALRSMPKKDGEALLMKLEAYASQGRSQNVTKLVGSQMLRLRHGDWRAIFEESDAEIIVQAIGNRREVYR